MDSVPVDAKVMIMIISIIISISIEMFLTCTICAKRNDIRKLDKYGKRRIWR